MTESNEEINEELSTDQLKSVSGGFPGPISQKGSQGEDRFPIDPKGSGSGMTRRDFERANKSSIVGGTMCS